MTLIGTYLSNYLSLCLEHGKTQPLVSTSFSLGWVMFSWTLSSTMLSQPHPETSGSVFTHCPKPVKWESHHWAPVRSRWLKLDSKGGKLSGVTTTFHLFGQNVFSGNRRFQPKFESLVHPTKYLIALSSWKYTFCSGVSHNASSTWPRICNTSQSSPWVLVPCTQPEPFNFQRGIHRCVLGISMNFL